ncbi:MAG TPA: response regulator transcription factor [Kineosporiaceae bacterium]|nr:response regulator transcription factor [Kineosporiaceae bacterium]
MTDPGGQLLRDGSQATRSRVLIVDDEEPLARLVATYLDRGGFEVALAFDGPSGVDQARAVDPDVVVLDLGLPGIDGLEVCRSIRTFSDCYVIMLTARSDEVDKLVGLSVGADDYMTKPFSPRELVARIHVLLRRPRAGTQTPGTQTPDTERPPLRFGPLVIDLAGRDVLLDDEPVPLTRTEFDLLATLAARPRMAFTRRQLIHAVWGQEWIGDEHLVDVHIGHLRRKLRDDAADARFIRTVRGVGYRLGTGE